MRHGGSHAGVSGRLSMVINAGLSLNDSMEFLSTVGVRGLAGLVVVELVGV